MRSDFIKEIKLLQIEGRMGKGLQVLRNQIWTRIATAHDARWMIANREALRSEIDGIVEEVIGGR
jgi:hypothetical protein